MTNRIILLYLINIPIHDEYYLKYREIEGVLFYNNEYMACNFRDNFVDNYGIRLINECVSTRCELPNSYWGLLIK